MDGFLKRKKERTEKSVLFCYEPDFEPGVSGIVATKLVENTNDRFYSSHPITDTQREAFALTERKTF
ncbi:hypothetical protein LEP1GSC193_0434 [Leptospira alstonii serovar Pingchang str. 80-412]|uniref:Uncharacterized protein n=1 Tax=Leptospira alstonii serovar Pingchang str. 80-412 TaxID=1218564 RepID=T0G026_9LEPT|nr:hypothetical protein LEP1GSC193_0434 [Leptospira alstonii serovar Pingchang str. 80-412]